MTAVLERPAATEVPARPPLSTRRTLIVWWAASLSIAALFAVAFTLVLSGSQERSAQRRLYSQFREQLADGTAALGPVIEPGHPVALLTIPVIGLSAVATEGTASADLRRGPGHRRDTALPGQAGVAVLYGKAVSYGGPFARIAELQRGDHIKVVTGQGTADYVVARVRRPGDPLPAPLVAGAGRLVLGSLEGDGWRAGWAPQQPVYVDALLSGKAQTAPAGRLTAVPAPEQLGAGDTGGLILVVLWLQGLVIAAIGTAWAAVRWGLWQAWLVGMPVVLVALWAVCNAALPLLPNVL